MHGPAAVITGYTRWRGIIGLHPIRAVVSSLRELATEVGVELIEQIRPGQRTLGHLIKALFHRRGETVVEQVTEAILQALCDNVPHLLGIEPPVLEPDVATILDGGNNRGIGGRSPNTPLLQLPHQTGFTVPRRRLGKMLFGVKLRHRQRIADRQRR